MLLIDCYDGAGTYSIAPFPYELPIIKFSID
jgi:hypothetical protein